MLTVPAYAQRYFLRGAIYIAFGAIIPKAKVRKRSCCFIATDARDVEGARKSAHTHLKNAIFAAAAVCIARRMRGKSAAKNIPPRIL